MTQATKQASKKTDFTVDLWWGSLRLASIINSELCSITVLNTNISQMSLVYETRKVERTATVETMLKLLEYITKGYIAMQTILI